MAFWSCLLYTSPGGPDVRFETAIYQDYFVPPFYDSMIGKLIVRGDNRELAIRKMKAALSELLVEGIDHNAELQTDISVSYTHLEFSYFGNWKMCSVLCDDKR